MVPNLWGRLDPICPAVPTFMGLVREKRIKRRLNFKNAYVLLRCIIV